jgi:hypothetical protein
MGGEGGRTRTKVGREGEGHRTVKGYKCGAAVKYLRFSPPIPSKPTSDPPLTSHHCISIMAPQKEVVLKLTSMRYKKEGVSEEEFHEHGSKIHGPKAAIVQARHGAVRVAQVSLPSFQELVKVDQNSIIRPPPFGP